MKKILAVIGVLFAFGMGLKLYNAREIKTAVQPQPEAVEVATSASNSSEVVTLEGKAHPQPEAVELATPASNSSEVVTLEGKAQVTFPDRQ